MSWLQGHRGYGRIWFRVFGWGLHVRDLRRVGAVKLLWSERNGFARIRQCGPFVVKILRPGR